MNGFRYSDECVRHKILDFIGDLALMGLPVLGRFEVRKAGHTLHSRFLSELMDGKGYSAQVAQMPVTIPSPYLSPGLFAIA